MITLYYVLIFRPLGSRTWTPIQDYIIDSYTEFAYNFFAREETAKAVADKLKRVGWKSYVPAKQVHFPSEIAIGRVELVNGEVYCKTGEEEVEE